MTEKQRRNHITRLDEETLAGKVFLSPWCTFIVGETDAAFIGGAFLAAILTAVAAIETWLRAEHRASERRGLSELIDEAAIDDDLRQDLHRLRRYRNGWVHVNDPWDDARLTRSPAGLRDELERTALFAVTTLRRVIFAHQWVRR